MPSTELPPDLLTSFASADSDQSRGQLLAAEQLLHSPQAVEALCDQANHWAREDPTLARKAASAALWLAKTLDHAQSEGLAHRTLANIFASLARPTDAFSEYREALRIFKGLDDELQAAITRSSALSIVPDNLGAHAAFDWAAKARLVFQETGDQLRLARLENNLAVVLFRQEDFERALEHWKAAHETLEEIGETSDQAATLRNLAVCSVSLNQPKEARSYYKQARELCEVHNFTFVLHEIDYNIAYLHFLQGDHHKALQLYQEARARSRELGDTYHEAYCSLDETEIYIELNLLEEADTVAQLAETQFGELQRAYEAAKALYNLALVRSLRGDPREALDHLDSAARAFTGQGNILWPGQVELLRSSIYSSEGRFFEARRSADLALSRFQQSGLPRRASLATLMLAKICHSQGAATEAERLCRTAVDTLSTFKEPDSLFQAFFLLGIVLDAQGDTRAALQAFYKAEEYLMELRERRSASRMRISIVDQPLEVYAHLVGLLLGGETGAPLSPEIFRLVETAKARSFADLMALSGVRTRTPTSMRSQLVDQVSDLRQELNWLYRRIDRSDLPEKATVPSVVESLQIQTQEKETELAQTLSLLRVRNPKSVVDPERIGIFGLEAVQDLLHECVFVEYFFAHDTVMAIVLSKDDHKVLPIAVTSTVRDLQRRLWHYLHHVPHGASKAVDQAEEPSQRILSELYSELLLPLEDLLGEAPLLVAPHGFLFLLPFHALQRDGVHLIERTPVTYVPSAATFSRVATGKPMAVRRYGVLDGSGDTKTADVFPEELGRSRKFFHGIDDEDPAPIQEVLERRWTAIHLIAKARLRRDNPLFSSIAFGREEVTFLDLYRSRMINGILSIEGEGFSPTAPSGNREVSALWGALLTSGARCAVVPSGFGSSSTHREHARQLYSELIRGSGVAVAHRRAMLTILRQGTSIHEWASPVLVGDPFFSIGEPIRTESS